MPEITAHVWLRSIVEQYPLEQGIPAAGWILLNDTLARGLATLNDTIRTGIREASSELVATADLDVAGAVQNGIYHALGSQTSIREQLRDSLEELNHDLQTTLTSVLQRRT